MDSHVTQKSFIVVDGMEELHRFINRNSSRNSGKDKGLQLERNKELARRIGISKMKQHDEEEKQV